MRRGLAHALTAGRVFAGAASIDATLHGKLDVAAVLITASAVLDGLDGKAARWAGSAGPFGALFDYFCDYLSFIVAPWLLARALAGGDGWTLQFVLALPLLTGAIRYSLNGVAVAGRDAEILDLPGVGTIFFAFLPVLVVFLDGPSRLSREALTIIVGAGTAVLSLLMLAPVRYPKLSLIPGASAAVLLLLTLMPFLGTRAIATAAILIGTFYIVAGPFLLRPHARGDAQDPRRDGLGSESVLHAQFGRTAGLEEAVADGDAMDNTGNGFREHVRDGAADAADRTVLLHGE